MVQIVRDPLGESLQIAAQDHLQLVAFGKHGLRFFEGFLEALSLFLVEVTELARDILLRKLAEVLVEVIHGRADFNLGMGGLANHILDAA